MSAEESAAYEGPWGPVPDVLFCLLPIIFLIPVTMFKRITLPTSVSLPIAAALMWCVRLMYLKLDPNLTNAAVIYGIFDALTPMSVIGGAILLFTTMEATLCMPFITQQIKNLSKGHPVAEVFIIAWAFAYMIEGASGFGTPVALASPMLASLGHDPFLAVVTCLIMNTLATQFGAVGTPIWFGLDGLGLNDDQLTKVGFRASIIVAAAAYVVPILCSSFLLNWIDIRRNIVFIILSISSVVWPSIGLAYLTYEFPSLVGGMVGVIVTGVLAYYQIGLVSSSFRKSQSRHQHLNDLQQIEITEIVKDLNVSHGNDDKKEAQQKKDEDDSFNDECDDLQNYTQNAVNSDKLSELRSNSSLDRPQNMEAGFIKNISDTRNEYDSKSVSTEQQFSIAEAIGRTFPLWGTVLLLVLTRVQQIEIKQFLRKRDPHFTIYLGTFAEFKMSVSLVITFAEILSEKLVSWSYEFLYVPSFIPFVVVSIVTILIYRKNMDGKYLSPFRVTFQRIGTIFMALEGALILVSLIRRSSEAGNDSPAYIIGYNLAEWLREGFVVISLLLGALGSFFSGSTTVSNLTFGVIQQVAAIKTDVSQKTLLAMQTAGATLGNCMCINNIIAAKAVMNMGSVPEGEFIRRTAPIALVFYIIGSAVGCLLLFGLKV